MSKHCILQNHYGDDAVVEAGFDEAGRGCFWGPIMAGALIWPNEDDWTDSHRELAPDIRDSKKIAEKKRERICDAIQRLAITWGVGAVNAAEIDEKGITWANQEAFRRALSQLSVEPERIIIDGTIGLPNVPHEQHSVINGDAKYLHVAGASILAKVGHDRVVKKYCEEYPDCETRYSLLSCHGYGTVKHREGLRTYGAHELHRRTFIYNWVSEGTTKPPIIDGKCLIRLPS